jgi:plastocyanin
MWALLLGAAVIIPYGRSVQAQAGSQGTWVTLPYTMPINPIHLALLHSGNVLIVSGSGNLATETTFRAALWNRQVGAISTQTLDWDMFCNGMVMLPDGRPFLVGGNLRYDPFYGERRSAAYDLATGTFSDLSMMAHGRWYPAVTMLGDGRVMAFSGTKETGGTNTSVEIYTPGVGWSPEYPAGWTPPLYPRTHLVPDGRVFYAGSGVGSRFFDPTTNTWSGIVATSSASRNYGTSVLLPLSPDDGYRARVMILGGGNPPLSTTELIDLSASPPLQWQSGPPMSQARIQLNATILPSGRVLVMGGSRINDDETTASLNADLYNPATNTFTSAGANVVPRVYHSGSLLLPDATVMLVGGNRARGIYQQGIEIYSPAYLFKADGTPADRPAIGSVPGAIGYGQAFQIQTQDAASVQSVVLVRPGAQTHAFDMDQRLVRMSFTPGSDQLTVTAPPNGNIAPPGYYMLFILNAAGVPSHAKFVQLSASVNQPPTGTIVSPATAVTVNPGDSVAFAGTGSDADGTISAYSWTFPTGSPGSSTQASANVMFATPGTHTVSFQVADDDGATSQPATRSITVADFSLAATPNSRTIAPGGSASYSATVVPQNGFTGTVSFGITGLPAGATASFSPATVTGSGSTTLGISTNTSIQAGTYPLVITGTSGPVTRTVSVTLVVNGDFTISVAPATATINPDGAATYSVAISSSGFSGTVLFSVSGLPKFATGKFNPTSIVNAGNTVFTVSTNKKVARGTYPLTIAASSGGLVRSMPITLVIQ